MTRYLRLNIAIEEPLHQAGFVDEFFDDVQAVIRGVLGLAGAHGMVNFVIEAPGLLAALADESEPDA